MCAGRVSWDRRQQRLELLAGYQRELRRLADLPVAEYLAEHAYAGRYLLQVAAQTCIDLANHLIAAECWRALRDFGDGFTVLHEQGVLDEEQLAGRLRGLAGMRNRLVHVYDEIDDARVQAFGNTSTPSRCCAGRCGGPATMRSRLARQASSAAAQSC